MAVVGRPHITATGLALAAPFASGSRSPDQSEIRRLLLRMIPGGRNYCRRILAVLKAVEDHRDEDIAGANQLRRHEDQLRKHETRIAKLETVQA